MLKGANNCWYFNIHEHDEYHAQLKFFFITSGPGLSTAPIRFDTCMIINKLGMG